MKKIFSGCAILMALVVSSCQDDKNLYEEKIEETAVINTSDFSTTQQVQVSVDYSTANAKVLFYVYDENPLTFGENNTVQFDESINPLDAAWTNSDGTFAGTMNLPAYVSEVYLISTTYYAQSVLKGIISNGTLTLSDTNSVPATRSASITRGYSSTRFASLGWTDLGTYDSELGQIDYAYSGSDEKLALTPDELSDMKEVVGSVIAIHKTCPEDYRMVEGDLITNKDNTEVVLTSLGGNTCWNNALGYYFYKDGETPASLSEVEVYTIFPNCQSGWTRGTPVGVINEMEGTAVQLKYFDDENLNGTTYFPKGYRIGFVLACNAWNTYYGTGTQNGFRASSTFGLSTPVKSVSKAHTAMFSKGEIIAICFEDYSDDENFSDVIFAIKARPAITNIPDVDEDNNTTVYQKGIYAFEDMWPKAADYDMNDVMAEYTYGKTFTPKGIYLQESFSFKTYANKADLDNGLALILKNTLLSGNVTIEDSVMYAGETEYAPTLFGRETDNGNIVVKFTDNVKSKMNATYKVTVKYDESVGKKASTDIDAFIYRPTNNGRLEVHCPMKTPTSFADMSFFNTEDDCSVPVDDIYYVSDAENIYPFAFYLNNATVDDVAPLLEPSNESTPISKLYSGFTGWAKDNTTNLDWYKK